MLDNRGMDERVHDINSIVGVLFEFIKRSYILQKNKGNK